jgi:hypothetical protein
MLRHVSKRGALAVIAIVVAVAVPAWQGIASAEVPYPMTRELRVGVNVNQPPTAPTITAPTEGALVDVASAQTHTIVATDPEMGTYQGIVTVRDVDGAVVRTFTTDQVASGQPSSGAPSPPLGLGTYTSTAVAVDHWGAPSTPSATRRFTVTGTVHWYSDDCTPADQSAQFWGGGAEYGALQSKGNDICFRLDGPALQFGGKVSITGPGIVSPQEPTTDFNTPVCNNVLLSGTISEPANIPYRIATLSTATAVSVCVDLGNEHRRIKLTYPTAPQPPTATQYADPPGKHAGSATTPVGLPSSTCTGKAGSTTALQVSADGSSTWLRTWQEPTRLHICAGTRGGPVNGGGMLTIDTSVNPGVTPVLSTGSDFTPCTQPVLSQDQTGIRIAHSELSVPDPDLVSMCVAVGATSARVTVGLSGDPTVPRVPITWAADPA